LTEPSRVVFLLDCDNTLLDNDHFEADLRAHLIAKVGADGSARYWHAYEALRGELGYADYLGALQRARPPEHADNAWLELSAFLLDYPFAERLYPGALNLLAQLGAVGPTVILTDGDVVFQPRKLHRSGLWQAVDGRVLIYIHKEEALDDVAAHYPASRYVLIDDKLRLLNAIKNIWHDRVRTVFPRQGHYAHDPQVATLPAADVTVDRIGDLDARALSA
jgi:FMN phosphatase YigB (HAD superfamily)